MVFEKTFLITLKIGKTKIKKKKLQIWRSALLSLFKTLFKTCGLMGPGLMEERLRPYTGRELQGEEATSGMTANTARQKKSCV